MNLSTLSFFEPISFFITVFDMWLDHHEPSDGEICKEKIDELNYDEIRNGEKLFNVIKKTRMAPKLE